MSRSARTYLVNFLNKELTEIFAGDASDAAVSNVSQLPQRLVHEYSAHRHRILAAVSRPSKKYIIIIFPHSPFFKDKKLKRSHKIVGIKVFLPIFA